LHTHPQRQPLPPEARLPLLLYNLFFPFVLLFLLPNFIVRMARRGKYRHRFGQRFGIYSARVRQRIAGKKWIWIHAVSVGEVLIALKLVKKMKELKPDLNAVLSTTTSTGFALAREHASDWFEPIYNPLDFPFIVRRALDLVRPSHLILVEAEVWPNLVSQAKKRGASVVLVNARLSPRSERRYRKFRTLVGPIFRLLDAVCVQEPEDVGRWQSLGFAAERVQHTGSIKFDHAGAPPSRADEFRQIVRALGVADDAPILLAGSTFPGEEEIIAKIFLALRPQFPSLFLILVPRHVERTAEIVAALKPLGLAPALRTADSAARAPGPIDCLVVNSTGELRDWYHLGTVIFIGKSLTATGGQNPVEAVMAGKPVLFGPHMENFSAVVRHLLAHGAASQVADTHELQTRIEALLRDPVARASMSAHAHEALAAHQGATERTASLLLSFHA
jgi:3-deoxy-D-manno-octulosonic-acid transferase